jgi:hypothetical protein
MISKHNMKLRYHDVCSRALEEAALGLTTSNCGWNAKQKEVSQMQAFLVVKAGEHKAKRQSLIDAHNRRMASEADEVQTSGV